MPTIAGVKFLIDLSYAANAPGIPDSPANPYIVGQKDYGQVKAIADALELLFTDPATSALLGTLAGKTILIKMGAAPPNNQNGTPGNANGSFRKGRKTANGLQFVDEIPHTTQSGTITTTIPLATVPASSINTAIGVLELNLLGNFNPTDIGYDFLTPDGKSAATSILRLLFHELVHAVSKDLIDPKWQALVPNTARDLFIFPSESISIDAENLAYRNLPGVSDLAVRVGHLLYAESPKTKSNDASAAFDGSSGLRYDGNGKLTADQAGGLLSKVYQQPNFTKILDKTPKTFVNYISYEAAGAQIFQDSGKSSVLLTKLFEGIASEKNIVTKIIPRITGSLNYLDSIFKQSQSDSPDIQVSFDILSDFENKKFKEVIFATGLTDELSASDTAITGPQELDISTNKYLPSNHLYLAGNSIDSSLIIGASGSKERNVDYENRVDYLIGGSGNDILVVGTGSLGRTPTQVPGISGNFADGQAGDDFLVGNKEEDELRGGVGNDTFLQSEGSDIIDGGAGRDTFILGDGIGSQTIDLGKPGNKLSLSVNGRTQEISNVEVYVGNDSTTTFIGNGKGIFVAGKGGAIFKLKAGDTAIGDPASSKSNSYYVDSDDVGKIRIINFKKNDKLFVNGVPLKSYQVNSTVSESELFGDGSPWDIIKNASGIQTQIIGSLGGSLNSLKYTSASNDENDIPASYSNGAGTAKVLLSLIPSSDLPDSVVEFRFATVNGGNFGEVDPGLQLVVTGYQDGYGGIFVRSDQLSLARQANSLTGFGTYAWSGSQIGEDLRGKYQDSLGVHKYSTATLSPYDPIWKLITQNIAESADSLLSDSTSTFARAAFHAMPNVNPNQAPGIGGISANATLDPSEYSFAIDDKIELVGDAAANTLDGAGVYNTLTGKGGGDTFIINAGYGVVVIDESDTAPGADNRLVLGAGLDLDTAVVFGDANGNIVLDFGNGDAIVLQSALRKADAIDGAYGVQKIEAFNGTIWSYSELLEVAITPNEYNDVLYGDSNPNPFDTQGIAHQVVGNGGGDTIRFDLGYGYLVVDERDADTDPANLIAFGGGISQDSITVTGNVEGDLILDLGDGNVIWLLGALTGADSTGYTQGIQSFSFDDGTAWNYTDVVERATYTADFNGTLFGDIHANTFDSAGYATDIVGNGGGDTIFFGTGYGVVSVYERDVSETPVNRIVFDESVDPESLLVRGSANGDITIAIDAFDAVVLKNALNSNSSITYGVQSLEFDDGTIWSFSDLLAQATKPSVENTALFGDAAANLFDSEGIATSITGGGGGDTIHYDYGYGPLSILEVDASVFPTNTLQLGPGILRENLIVSGTAGGDLILSFGGADTVTLIAALLSSDGRTFGIQTLDFDDGQSLSYSDLLALAGTASSSHQEIYGDSSANILDTLGIATAAVGGGGGDTFRYERGYGPVIIDERDAGTSSNKLAFGSGIDISDISVSGSIAGDVIIDLGAGDVLTLKGALLSLDGLKRGVQLIEFFGGSSIIFADLISNLATAVVGSTVLYGDTSANTLNSSGIANILVGNGGGDVFQYDTGQGAVVVDERDLTSLFSNVIVLGVGIETANVRVSGTSDGDLLLQFGVSDSVLIKGALKIRDEDGIRYGVDAVLFDDGTVWEYADLIRFATTASATNISLFGDSEANILASAGFANLLVGNGGSDKFVFEAGDGAVVIDERDTNSYAFNELILGSGIDLATVVVTGNEDQDVLLDFGNGDLITIKGGLKGGDGLTYGVQAISFADGTVWTYSDILSVVLSPSLSKPTLFGSADADIFDTEGLVAHIVGNGGGDTIYYELGYGALTIDEQDSSQNPRNALILGQNINPGTTTVSALPNGDLVLDIGGDDVITITGILNSPGASTSGVQSIEFSDGTAWNIETIRSFFAVSREISLTQGHVKVDFAQIPVSILPELVLDALAEDVTVTISPDGQILTIATENGSLALKNFSVSNAFSNQSIRFADGIIWNISDVIDQVANWDDAGSVLIGSTAPETFGLSGQFNVFEGGGGGDTFRFNRGDGALYINENDSLQNLLNKIVLGAGFLLPDLQVTTVYGNIDSLRLDFGDGDVITLVRGLHLNDDYTFGVQQLVFPDSQILTYGDLVERLTTGSATNDGDLIGDTFANIFDPKGYSTSAIGNGGGDVFKYNVGYGYFSIFEYAREGSPDNIIQLGEGLNPSSTEVTADDSSIILRFSGGDEIRIVDALSEGRGIQEVQFADGTIWTAADLLAKVSTATIGVNSIYGDSHANILDPAGIANFVGGHGGGDTIIYNLGYGFVYIDEKDYGPVANNKLVFGAGIVPSNVTITTESIGYFNIDLGNGDQISFLGSGTYKSGPNEPARGIQAIEFADGTTWNYAQILALADAPTTTHKTLFGDEGANVFNTLGIANNVIFYGNDTLNYNIGDGTVHVDVLNYNLTTPSTILNLGAGITPSTVAIGTYGDTLTLGFAGNDRLIFSKRVNEIHFADGTTWDADEISEFYAPTSLANSTIITNTSNTTAAISKRVSVNGQTTPFVLSGAINFNDLIAGDSHTAIVTHIALAGYTSAITTEAAAAWFSLSTPQEANLGVGGSIGWQVTVPGNAFDHLGLSSSSNFAELTYTIQVRDAYGNLFNRDAKIYINGVSTVPGVTAPYLVTGNVSEGSVVEIAGETSGYSTVSTYGQLKFSGTRTFNADAVSRVSVQATGATEGLPSQSEIESWLYLYSDFAASTLSGGIYSDKDDWSFNANDKTFDYLSEGETVTFVYTVEITDRFGGKANFPITIVVTGTNDGVVATEGSTTFAFLTEDPDPEAVLNGGGTLLFTDPDRSDTHTVSVSNIYTSGSTIGLPDSSALQTLLTLDIDAEPNGDAAGVVSWDFNAVSNLFGYLGEYEYAYLTYELEIADQNGGVNTQYVTILVQGAGTSGPGMGTPEDPGTPPDDENHAPETAAPETVVASPGVVTSINGLVVSDVDIASYETVTLIANGGRLKITLSDTIFVSGNNSRALTISGSLDEINAALGTLTYQSITDNEDTILVTTSDGSLRNQLSIEIVPESQGFASRGISSRSDEIYQDNGNPESADSIVISADVSEPSFDLEQDTYIENRSENRHAVKYPAPGGRPYSRVFNDRVLRELVKILPSPDSATIESSLIADNGLAFDLEKDRDSETISRFPTHGLAASYNSEKLIAIITQDMASFGARSGESDLKKWQEADNYHSFDFFA